MMRRTTIPLLLLLSHASAVAADPPPARYAFVPAAEGTLRLDTVTGEVSLCSSDEDGISCSSVPHETGDGDARVRMLERRLEAVEARLAALEERMPAPGAAEADEQSLDRILALTDRVMRHFVGLVRELKRDPTGEER